MTPDDVRSAATALVALDAGFLGVVITLVALLPALAEAALRGIESEYDSALRGALIEGQLRALRLQIPLFTIAVVSSGSAWLSETEVALIIAAVLTLGGLVWLSYVAYVVSQSLGRFLIERRAR